MLTVRWPRISPLLLISAWLVPGYVFAEGGTEGAAFLNLPIAGAPAAMGSSYSSLATDAYAPVINPGGLGFLDSMQFAGHHMEYLETLRQEFLSLVSPLSSRGALGASVQYLGSGDITQRNENGTATGDFSTNYSATTLAYGHAFSEHLALGLAGRWIHASLDDVTADAFAGDAGLLAKVNPRLQAGLVVANIGSDLQFLSKKDQLPTAVRGGGAYLVSDRLLVSAEGAYHLHTELISGHFGGQWKPLPVMALRAGYRTDLQEGQSALAGFSTGIGLSFWRTELSYTWLPYGELGQTHSFAIQASFGKSRGKERNLIQYHAQNRPQQHGTAQPVSDDALFQLLSESESRSMNTAQQEGSR